MYLQLAELGNHQPTLSRSHAASSGYVWATTPPLRTSQRSRETHGRPRHKTGYVIDREGKVVNAWYGYEQGHPKVREFLEKMGIPEAAPTP